MQVVVPSRIRESAIIELISIGLTRYEASLYVTMLSFDSSSYEQLIEESDVPYGRFYVIADMLESKGLVEVIPGRPNRYRPYPPNEAISKYLTDSKDRVLRALDMEQMLATI